MIKELIDEVSEKLEKLYRESICDMKTNYTQNLVLFDDGELGIYRLEQNETLQMEFEGRAITLYSIQEFDITDIEGWEDGNIEEYFQETWRDFLFEALQEIERKILELKSNKWIIILTLKFKYDNIIFTRNN